MYTTPTLASLIPDSLVFGLSSTRKAAKLAVYEATIIIANPAHTIPRTLAEKLLGVPSPIPLFNNTPQANHVALDRFSASSSVPSALINLNRANGENLSSKYRTSATTWTEPMTSTQSVWLNGCKNDTRVEDRDGYKQIIYISNCPSKIPRLTFFSRIVIPWYLNGLLNSMNSARSGLMVSGAKIISARSYTNSPIKPFHSFLTVIKLSIIYHRYYRFLEIRA